MEVAAHIEALRAEGARTAAAVAASSPDAAVPTCPEWVVRDLVRHLGGVHRWATSYVAEARTEVWAVELDEVVVSWPHDAELAAWLGQGCAALADALAAAPPNLECWTFLRAPSPLAMWARRQAHETAIHRVDAELAAGIAVSPMDASFAADGVGELLECFVPRRSTKLRAEEAASLLVGCTDHDAAWVLRIGADGVTTEALAGVEPGADCTVRGPATDLYLALWNRASPASLSVEGDDRILSLFSDRVQIRWA
jgi:uncharacterized protein (TIGR03083 family)